MILNWLRWWLAKKRITKSFENARTETWNMRTLPNTSFNCLAFAVGDQKRWWGVLDGEFWPEGYEKSWSVESVRKLISGLFGYGWIRKRPTPDCFALYVSEGVVKHVARRTNGGLWWSKLGDFGVVEHTVEAIIGAMYGKQIVYLSHTQEANLI